MSFSDEGWCDRARKTSGGTYLELVTARAEEVDDSFDPDYAAIEVDSWQVERARPTRMAQARMYMTLFWLAVRAVFL
jgi:hypothetical protein